jgi:hypothetical protein
MVVKSCGSSGLIALTLCGAGESVYSGRPVSGRMETGVTISGQNLWLEDDGHHAVVTSGRMRLAAASAKPLEQAHGDSPN